MGERVRWRLAANVGVVMALFASVFALAAVAAPEARADGGTCTKAVTADGVVLTVVGFSADDSAAIRRNGKWVQTVDSLGDPMPVAGSLADDWKLRVRGPEQPDPYLEVTCTAAPAGADASCSIVDAGTLRAEFTGFSGDDSLNLRRNGKWVATVDGAVESIDDLPGSLDDTWTLRARGADFEQPYSTIDCTTGDVPPPPPADSFCRVTDAGLEWDDAGADQYQVRRDGKWVATATERSWPTDDLDADWIIRYRSGGERIDQPCERAEADSPCIIAGETIDSIMNGPQCKFAEEYLIEVAELVDGDEPFDPCEAVFYFTCVDGAVTSMYLEFFAPDGLRHFPDVTGLTIEGTVVNFDDLGEMRKLRQLTLELVEVEVTAAIGNLVMLEEISFFSSELETLPPEIGALSVLRRLDLSESTIRSLPEEIGQLNNLEVLELFGSSLRTLPDSIGELGKITELHVSRRVESLPSSVYNGASLERLIIDSSVNFPMPLAQGTPASLADIVFWNGPVLAGDQTDWLVSLGDPNDHQISVQFQTEPCSVWVTDAAWNARLAQLHPNWLENCQPPG